MKACFILLVMLLFSVSVSAEDWQVIKGQHFLVYYKEGKGFAEEASARAELYYDQIAADLGYARYDKFWQWENRVKIYIYPCQEDFSRATGKPAWVFGMARYQEKEIISYGNNDFFLASLLPHEIAHLIFRDFVGFKGEVPLWLDEGVAQWQEADKRASAIKVVQELIKAKGYFPLEQLMREDIRKNLDQEVSRKFYAQAATLAGYLLKEHGSEKFSNFCRQLRDGKNMDEALRFIYANDSINNINELEGKWLKYYGG